MQVHTTRQQVRRVLVITLIFNLLVAFGKIIVGVMSGALAITADGFHSLMDGTSNIAGLIANHIASKPPDDDHPYGHRRFETLAGLLIGALLILTAWEITTSAIDRLQSQFTPELSVMTFAVMISTLIINIGVSRYQTREGKRLQSELLIADSANTRTDVFITLSVIISMMIVELTGWAWVDLVSAIIVVGLIARAAWEIFQQTGSILVDKAPYTSSQLQTLIGKVAGIERIIRARSRGSLDASHIDIDVLVAPNMTTAQTNAISTTIHERLHQHLTHIAEVEVHFAVGQYDDDDYALIARVCADALGLSTHEVQFRDVSTEKLLDLHVEVPEYLTLEQAHQQVCELEQRLYEHLPELTAIITHIEPANTEPLNLTKPPSADAIIARAETILNSHYTDVDWHDLRVYSFNDDLALTLHAVLSPDVSIGFAHRIAEHAEHLLKNAIPTLRRVTIHTEPEDHDFAHNQATPKTILEHAN